MRTVLRLQQLTKEVEADLMRSLDRHNMKAQRLAQKELYPGHGKLTGTLQRSIQIKPSRRIGLFAIRGYLLTRGVPYARRIHRRYRYLTIGMRKAGPFNP